MWQPSELAKYIISFIEQRAQGRHSTNTTRISPGIVGCLHSRNLLWAPVQNLGLKLWWAEVHIRPIHAVISQLHKCVNFRAFMVKREMRMLCRWWQDNVCLFKNSYHFRSYSAALFVIFISWICEESWGALRYGKSQWGRFMRHLLKFAPHTFSINDLLKVSFS